MANYWASLNSILAKWSQIIEDTVEPSLPAREINLKACAPETQTPQISPGRPQITANYHKSAQITPGRLQISVGRPQIIFIIIKYELWIYREYNLRSSRTDLQCLTVFRQWFAVFCGQNQIKSHLFVSVASIARFHSAIDKRSAMKTIKY